MFSKSEIVLSPNPVLREPCEQVTSFDKELKKLSERMLKAMYKTGGVGLAAPQIGVSKRLIVVDCDYDEQDRNPLVLVNPELVEHSDEQYLGPEGCLSIPGVCFEIPRYTWVKVRAQDLEGSFFELEAEEGLFNRCLQHEIDHTNGITMFERLDPAQRMQALRLYQEALAAGARPGDVD